MPDVGAGVMQIRPHGDNEFRVFYVARFEEAVYVLHSFVKKTRATRKTDVDLGKARYAPCWKQGEDALEIDQRNDNHKRAAATFSPTSVSRPPSPGTCESGRK